MTKIPFDHSRGTHSSRVDRKPEKKTSTTGRRSTTSSTTRGQSVPATKKPGAVPNTGRDPVNRYNRRLRSIDTKRRQHQKRESTRLNSHVKCDVPSKMRKEKSQPRYLLPKALGKNVRERRNTCKQVTALSQIPVQPRHNQRKHDPDTCTYTSRLHPGRTTKHSNVRKADIVQVANPILPI